MGKLIKEVMKFAKDWGIIMTEEKAKKALERNNLNIEDVKYEYTTGSDYARVFQC
ncbi:MAG: hypothetical protein R3Y43_00540 [Alphaproteobacteria bacterium]